MERRTRQCLKDAIKFMAVKGLGVAFAETFSANLARNRNRMVDEAQQANADYLMFIDDDMTFDPDSIYNLWLLKEDVVSGLAVGKMYPHKPGAANINPETGKHDIMPHFPPQGLITVDGVGTGFMMIKMMVFDKITKPYFAFAPNGDDVTGEDYFFCAKAREAGCKIRVDCGSVIGHLGPYAYTIHDYRLGLEIEAERAKEEDGPTGACEAEGGIRQTA
jgi:hypothetical protein